MIKLSIQSMARYLRASPEKQRDLLRDVKFQPAGLQAQLSYYRTARTTIAAYHRGDLSHEQVEAQVALLRAQAKTASHPEKAELVNTAEVVERYLNHQGHRRLLLSPSQTWDLVRSEVRLSARPTMIASEHEVTKLIFLQFGRGNKDVMRLVMELAYEVISPWKRSLPLQSIQLIDRSGTLHELDRRSSALGRDLALACKAISKQWPAIEPPAGRPNAVASGSQQLSMELQP